jgi:hypothetical protein
MLTLGVPTLGNFPQFFEALRDFTNRSEEFRTLFKKKAALRYSMPSSSILEKPAAYATWSLVLLKLSLPQFARKICIAEQRVDCLQTFPDVLDSEGKVSCEYTSRAAS